TANLATHTYPTRRSSDLGPRSNKIPDELLFAVILGIKLRIAAENGIRSKNQVHSRRRPFDFSRRAIPDFIQTIVFRNPSVSHIRSEEHTSELQSRENLVF